MFVVLVIAADEGIMPQTREHLDICRLLGVKKGLVAVTKSDLVEEEWLELVKEEIENFVQGTFLRQSPIIFVSSSTGQGLDNLKVDEKDMAHIEAIICSMTRQERQNFKVINGSRRRRIAAGSGRPVSEVNRLLKQYMQTRKMMKHVSKGFLGKRLPKLGFPM